MKLSAYLLLLGVGICHAAYAEQQTEQFHLDGPPMIPTSPAACEAYRKEQTLTIERINQHHTECLKRYEGARDPYLGSYRGPCSRYECQRAHVLRDTFTRQLNDNVSECNRTVARREQYLRDEEQRRAEQQREAGISEQRERLTKDALDKLRDKNLINRTPRSTFEMQLLIQKCQRATTLKERNACIDQLHASAGDAMAYIPRNKVAAETNKRADEELNRMQKELNDALIQIDDQMNQIAPATREITPRPRGVR